MKKVHLHFTLLLTALCLSSACNSGQKGNGASASDSTSVDSAMVQETMVENETFTTDSVVFNKENEHASCYICVDIPKGNAKVVPTISKLPRSSWREIRTTRLATKPSSLSAACLQT